MPEEQDLQNSINELKKEFDLFKLHDHFFDGEKLKIDSLQLSDNTTNNVSSIKHGLTPKSPADATKFLNGATTPDYALIKDSDLSTSDITTNDVTTSKHGFTPKAPNDTTKFLRGDATWAAAGFSLATATIANNTNVTTSASPGTNTDTVVTHGLGKTPTKITVSARIFAKGKTSLTGGANKIGHAIAIYNTSTSSPILINGHIFIDKDDNAADIATARDLVLTGTESFETRGTPSTDNHIITITIVSIGATTFTFRINGVVVGTPEAGNSTVTNISWIAEG